MTDLPGFDTSDRDRINRFTESTYAEMYVWDDTDDELQTSDSTVISYIALVVLALMLGGVACWLGWAHV